MPFPESPRVIYDRNPLESVICQLRFPEILRIDSEIPSQFQERVRQAYPIFEHKQVRVDIAQLMGQTPPIVPRSAYDFSSPDGTWTLGLTAGAISLRTIQYVSWREFKERFEPAITALIEVYQPVFYSRIGLRYRDVIVRSALGIANQPWIDLIQPHIAGELLFEPVAKRAALAIRNLIVDLVGDIGKVRIQHGLGESDGQEQCFIIDSDFYREDRVELADAFGYLDEFNRRAGRLFRWCITSALHNAMGPKESQAVGADVRA